jgi:hypothetical protein
MIIIRFYSSYSHFYNRGCVQLTGHGLRTLSEYCPNLQVLIIKDCRGLSAASISHFLTRSNQLRVLDVSGLDTVKSSTLMSVNNPALNKLEKLNMSWCRNIAGPGILSMISASSNSLRYLKLNGCPQLDDATMSSLGSNLPNLSRFCLAACTSLTDSALLAFLKAHSGEEGEKSKLTHLNLSSCVRLTDASLRNLAIYSPNITHLELAGCLLMTDQGFSFLSPRLRTLVHLDLEDLLHITGVTVQAIASHQPDLVRLCLSNCTQISDDAITHLVLEGICHKLQHLELDNCTITDECLNTIAIYLQKHQRRLSEITSALDAADSSVSFFSSSPSPSTSDASLSASQLDQQLQQKWIERKISVEVLDCSNITESGVREALAKASPMLTIKSFYSFQGEDDNEDEQQQQQVNDEDSMDNIHRHHNHHRSTSSSSSYNAIGRGGRRAGGSHAAGQHHSANCIIL